MTTAVSILISIMGSCGSPIELDNDVPFIEKDWIGQGKKYTEVPDFVRWKKDSDMEIPPDFLQKANFPKAELSVNEFLALKLPRISSEIISNKVARWFTKISPSISDPQIL